MLLNFERGFYMGSDLRKRYGYIVLTGRNFDEDGN